MAVIGKKLFHSVFGGCEKHEAPNRGRYVSVDDQHALLALVMTFRPRVFIEFGVQRGGTAAYLLERCECIERYIGIDVPPGFQTALPKQRDEVPAVAGELALDDPRFEVLILDGGTQSLNPGDLPDAEMVFIDADHSEAGCRHDTILARRCLIFGGVCCWHDYGSCEGVEKVIDELNDQENDQITHLYDTWVCFELRRPNWELDNR